MKIDIYDQHRGELVYVASVEAPDPCAAIRIALRDGFSAAPIASCPFPPPEQFHD